MSPVEIVELVDALALRLEVEHAYAKANSVVADALPAPPLGFADAGVLVRQGDGGLEAVANSGAGRIYLEMQLYNGELLSFCEEVAAICIDLAGDLAFETQDFYDAIHTTPRGSRKIGEYLAKRWPIDVE